MPTHFHFYEPPHVCGNKLNQNIQDLTLSARDRWTHQGCTKGKQFYGMQSIGGQFGGHEPRIYPFVSCDRVCVCVCQDPGCNLPSQHTVCTHSLTYMFVGGQISITSSIILGENWFGMQPSCSCITHTPCDSQRKARRATGENSFVAAPPNWNNMQGTAYIYMKRKWKSKFQAPGDEKSMSQQMLYIHLSQDMRDQRIKGAVVARKRGDLFNRRNVAFNKCSK